MRTVVCHKNEIAPGDMKEATLGRAAIVVCRTSDGNFYAFTNRCIHQGAPLSKGKLCGAPEPTDTVGEYKFCREGEIIRCPWHGREFDAKNKGRTLANPKFKLKEYKVEIEDDKVVVYK